jgi:hypothetical protein
MSHLFQFYNVSSFIVKPENPYRRGILSTIDLLIPTSLYQLLRLMKILFIFFLKGYLIVEVNCTGPYPTVSFPWLSQG